jgi:hypothetical protein
MSSHQEEFVLHLSPASCRASCLRAAGGAGWHITGQADTSLSCKEIAQPGLSFTNPVQIDISLTSAGDNDTRVAMRGSNFGFGPLQSGHVKRQVQALRRQIEQAADRAAEPAATRTLGHAVVVNGERLGDDELAALPPGVRVADGRYWYDRISGAWGFEGGPTAGFVMPGLVIGGALRVDTSNGNTGVFINGRQLHVEDVSALRQLLGQVLPGRWWIDAQGNFGLEGLGMSGNLWLLAQQRSSSPTGGPSRSASSMTVAGEGGFIYAQGRDALGNYIGATSG